MNHPYARTALGLVTAAIGLLVLAPVIVVGLPFWLVASLTRALARRMQPTVVSWDQLLRFDPDLGWRPLERFSGHCLEERSDVFYLRTGADGWPAGPDLEESPIVVIGDSYAFGYSVDHDDAFFRKAQGVKAIGAPGYSMVQEVLIMERLSASLKDKLVVWFVYLGNDLYDNVAPAMAGYRSPFVRSTTTGDGWEIVSSHLSEAKWTCSAGRTAQSAFLKWRIEEPGFQSDRAYEAARFLAARAHSVCKSAGARLVIVTIPTQAMLEGGPGAGTIGDPAYADRRFEAICRELGIEFMPLRQELAASDYRGRDDHWTESGHEKVARFLSRLRRD